MSNIGTIEKKYFEIINNPEIKYISFDIFDTLVFRNLVKPSDLFKILGETPYVKKIFVDPLLFQQFRIESEQKARKASNNEEIIIDEIYQFLPITSKQKEKIINLELALEKKYIRFNKQILNWIKLANEKNKKVIFISDTYFSKEELHYLIFSEINIPIHLLFISSEKRVTKFTGNLFSKVLEELDISAKDIYHIGDNYHSDIDSSAKYNIKSLLYNLDEEYRKAIELDSQYMKNEKFSEFHNFRILSALNNPYKDKQKRFFFNFGATVMGPIIWDFCHYLINIYKQNKYEQINFCMREGRIFYKFIKFIDNSIDTNMLFVSRKSTFIASLDINEIKKENFRLENYEDFTVKNLYELFKLNLTSSEIKNYNDYKFLLKNKFDEKYVYILKIIQEDFKTNKKFIISNIKKEKELLTDYLKNNNIKKNSILVEFGGTGSIPTNIKNSLPKKLQQKLNVLFFMHDKGIKKMLGNKTISYFTFSDQTKDEIRAIHSFPTIFEILFNGAYSTTLGYDLSESNQIIPKTAKKNTILKEYQFPLIEAFDKGIEQFFILLKEYDYSNTLLDKSSSLKIINRFLKIPTFDEALNLGNLYHEAGYGSNHIFQVIEKKDEKYLKKEGIDNLYRQIKLIDKFKEYILWPEGLITKYSPLYLIQMNGLNMHDYTKKINPYAYEILNTIKEQKIKKLNIYGTGELFKQLLPLLTKSEIILEYVFDSRASLIKNKIYGFKVYSLNDILLENNATIIIASQIYKKEISSIINNYSKDKNICINII